MRRLNPLDAGLRALDDEHSAVHIGGISVFEGPVPPQAEIERLYRQRLPAMPRCRQRMRSVPLGLDWPVWVDDGGFDLTYHLRRAALPAPGGDAELEALVGRLFSQRLDLSRPAWEAWVVEGLADDRWALITKMHHVMADGMTGMAQFASLLDGPPHPVHPHRPGPEVEPGSARMLGSAVVHRAAVASRAARSISSSAFHPVQTAGAAIAATRGALAFGGSLRPTTRSSLTGPLDTPRRYRLAAVDLDDIRTMREGLGGSLNDAVLTIVSRAFRALLVSRGEAAAPHGVRCLVPVSVRHSAAASQEANQVSAMLVELPVDFGDPGSAYGATTVRMGAVKNSHEVDAGEACVTLAGYLPPALATSAFRAAFRIPQRVLTTVVTNVPGPRGQARMLGRPLIAVYPYVPIADRVRIGVAVTTYRDQLFFGVTCDRASVSDADVFIDGLRAGVIELVKAAVTARDTSP